MNSSEFYNEFNLEYNNISSNQAPGLTPSEISSYLTNAQYALIDLLYKEFENSEEVRRKLANIVVTKQLGKLNNINSSNFIYPEYTVAFSIPDKLRYIVHEKLKMSDKAERCIRDKFIAVTPTSHDEIDRLIKNPFRFNNNRAFRLDTSLNNDNSDREYIEIITKDKNVAYYQIRYIKTPPPIILEDISPDTIDGVSSESLCILHESLHRQIVEIAAKMAYQDYKQ